MKDAKLGKEEKKRKNNDLLFDSKKMSSLQRYVEEKIRGFFVLNTKTGNLCYIK